jgi:hypothetical protein
MILSLYFHENLEFAGIFGFYQLPNVLVVRDNTRVAMRVTISGNVIISPCKREDFFL